jgi:RNA polymerase sigma-70 factor (ECF subfamily)
MRAFLYRIAHNLVIDHYRKKKPVSLDDLSEQGFDPGVDTTQQLENQIDGAQALKMLDRIPSAYRDVIFMHYVGELSVKEIAETLNESPNNVSVKIHRGLEKVRKLYNDNGS